MSESVDDQKFHTVLSYARDYVAGVLWLLAWLSAALSWQQFRAIVVSVDLLVADLPHLRAPDLVISLMVIIAGVILPYCVEVAIKPLSFLFMTAIQVLQRRAGRAKHRERLERRLHAKQVIDSLLNVNARISTTAELLILEVHQPTMARRLGRGQAELNFRVGTLLPASFLLGVAIAKMTTTLAGTWAGIAGGVVVFGIGAWSANSTFEALQDDVLACLVFGLRSDANREP
jgi:hypothetical protein